MTWRPRWTIIHRSPTPTAPNKPLDRMLTLAERVESDALRLRALADELRKVLDEEEEAASHE